MNIKQSLGTSGDKQQIGVEVDEQIDGTRAEIEASIGGKYSEILHTLQELRKHTKV